MMSTDYPNPYETTEYNKSYEDPYNQYSDNQYNGMNEDGSQGYRNETNNYNSYGDSYNQNQDSFSQSDRFDDFRGADEYSNSSRGSDDYNSRTADQNERDRLNRRNRSERRRELLRRDDRDRDRMRDRDRDRVDRDRDSLRRERGRDRDYDRHSYSDRERERRDRDSEDRAGEKWMTDTPTNTILLRGLPHCIEEKDIKAELMLFGAPIKDVRLMRKSSGSSRGFAFVEFQNVDDALRWMDANQQKLVLQNQYTCQMHFSTPKDPKDKQLVHKMDWTCVKCGVHNFKRRDYCFKCNMSRYESGKSQADGYDHVGTNPCNTLLFRGLDAMTTEENLLNALNSVSEMTCKNIKVICDPASSLSLGFAFVELSSVAESMNILEMLKALNPAFEVDGKQIIVSFAKNTFNTSIATITAANQQQSWDQSSDYYQNYDYSQQQAGYDQSGYYSGQYYDGQQSQQQQPGYDYSSYYGTTTTATDTTTTAAQATVATTTTTPVSTDSTNAAAAVAQAAIQQAQAAKNYQKQVQQQQKMAEMSKEERLAHQAQEWKQKKTQQEKVPTKPSLPTPPSGVSDGVKYPTPDVSLYQFDETSGYYYDPITTLYYDANSQYYYNGNTGQFLYWDAELSTYLVAPQSTSPSEDPASLGFGEAQPEKKEGGGKERKEKVKVAKKIAKDMEKWAKSMNAQKEALKDAKKINLPNLSGRKESATADAGFAILEKVKQAPEDNRLMPPPPMPEGSTPDKPTHALVASYGGDSDDDDEDGQDVAGSGGQLDENKLMDFSKMACLLCKRQFQSKDQLTRHSQMSDLHKQNLEKLRLAYPSSSSPSDSGQYRDRAKERREKIGSTAPPPRKRPTMPEPFEQPTKAGIGEDNIGSKMLQKMGWSAGQGLGKTGQGRTAPIQAERRSATAGLGARGANYPVEDAANYKESVKKAMFARFKELD